MEGNQKVGVEVEIEKDREGGNGYVGQPVVYRGRERELGGVGGEGEGGGGRELMKKKL